jgi:glycosyltransferase involved in cell wall biosynthesis
MPYFSVIIPTYNRANLIERTVQSVLAQSFTDFEIIIVDDGSTDNTGEIIAAIKSDKINYIKKQNEERAVARNTGTKLAIGKYITFLDSDDLFEPNHLQVAKDVLEGKNCPAVFHTRYNIITSERKVVEIKELLDDNLNRKLIEGNFMSCHGVFLLNEIAKVNLFNEDRALSALEDWELWLRLASKYKIEYSNEITSSMISHDLRSVVNTNKEALIIRMNTFMKYVLANEEVVNYYKADIHKFKSSCYSYIALHIALTKTNRSDTFNYMLKAIKENPKFVFSRRFLAIVKHFM